MNDAVETVFEAAGWLAVFALLLAMLVERMDEGVAQFEVYAIFILMIAALGLFTNAAVELSTGSSVVDYVRRRKAVPKQYRSRIK